MPVLWAFEASTIKLNVLFVFCHNPYVYNRHLISQIPICALYLLIVHKWCAGIRHLKFEDISALSVFPCALAVLLYARFCSSIVGGYIRNWEHCIASTNISSIASYFFQNWFAGNHISVNYVWKIYTTNAAISVHLGSTESDKQAMWR